MTNPRSTVVLPVIASLLFGAGCSESSNDTPPPTPAFEADTSYLDGLADDQGIETPSVVDEPTIAVTDQEPEPEPEKLYLDEEREWTAEKGSKSILGKSRDRAIDLGSQLQNSTKPENGLAITYADEEYAQAAGFAWDMREDWRMAVPSFGRFAEMFIESPLGNASISFTKETDSPAQVRRRLEATITDTFSGRSKAQTSTKTVMGFPVTAMDLSGTFIDPGAKGSSNGAPFYRIHAVVIELPTTKVLIKLWGPSDTVEQNIGKFDAMIDAMYER